MIALSTNNLTKYYGIDLILDKISFTASVGDKIGLIGNNGTGKSTLFNILTKQIPYDSGELFFNKDLKIGYLKQDVEFDEEDTLFSYCKEVFKHIIDLSNEIRSLEHEISDFGQKGLDPPHILLEKYSEKVDKFTDLNGYAYESEIRGILRGIGFEEVDFLKPVKFLSGGQKSRLNLAKLLLIKPDILLLDEPTNHLDIKSVSWLEGFISKYSGTVFIISHDRYFLDQVINKVFEIENKSLLEHPGTYSAFVTFKKALFEQKLKEYENQKKEIDKQEEIVRRFKGHGTEKLAKRARSREKRLDMMEISEKPTQINDKAKIKLTTKVKSGYEVLRARELTKYFDDKMIFENLEFDIYNGDKIGLIGPNGVGKTTLFRTILGEIPMTSGEIIHGHHVNIGYYDQEQTGLTPENNLVEEISNERPEFTNTEIRNLLGAFLFKEDDAFKIIANLSGGEKGRLSLLKLMLSNSNVLLLDEPTNHLDISSKEALEGALDEYDGTTVSISHDRYFLNKVCNKIFELTKDGVAIYIGNYSYYLEKKAELELLGIEAESSQNSAPKTKTQVKDERRREKDKLKEEKKLKTDIKNIEEKIHQDEFDIEELEHELCREEVFSDHNKSMEISLKIESLKNEIDELYVTWEELMS
ncbi:MAG: ABC-F family ATP-binding cassette domain-containing protein [Acidaminobacteraceae bacterium]